MSDSHRIGQDGFTLNKMAESMRRALAEMDEEDENIETTESDEGEKRAADVAAPTRINFFQHPDSHPAVLDLLLLQKYGPEWMLWEPEVLAIRIAQDFHTQGVSDMNMGKIQAMKTLHFIDTPWQRWEVFVWCAMPLNSAFPDFEMMQVPTAAQCLVAIDIFNLTRQDVAWSDEVKIYLGAIWRHEGMFVSQEPAEFITIDRSGTDLDYDKIEKMWPQVEASGEAPTADTADAEQLRRMLDADRYLAEQRELFERQLKAVIGV